MSRYASAFGRDIPSGLAVANPSSLLAPKFSVRLNLHDEGLQELAETMRDGHAGILHPLIVRKTKAGLERVVGGRRQRAAKIAGLTSVPIIVRDMDDATAFETQLIENLHYRALSDYELGRAFDHMLRTWKDRYRTQEALGKKIGKSQEYVSLHIRAFETAEELKEDRNIARAIKPSQIEQMNERQLRHLGQIPTEERAEILDRLIAEKPEIKEAEPFKPALPSGRELERRAKEIKDPARVKHTCAQITCPECQLTFAIVHKEHRGGRAEHRLEQVIVA
jgi:ParB family chromosome partitioning protein